jgi:hypothetical protein
MDLQTVRLLTGVERRLDTQELPEKSSDLISPFLALPALRAFWPMSAVDYTNPQARDISGGGYHLTNNNTATFGYDPNRVLVPCAFFDGVNQYLSRADGGAANWADIVGTETYIENTAVTARGLTLGGWFLADTLTAAMFVMSKSPGSVIATHAYSIQWRGDVANDPFLFRISDGVAFTTATSTVVTQTDSWYFAVGRFRPSTNVDVFVNGTQDNAGAAPAAIIDAAAAFTIGAHAVPGNYLDGRASLCFLCAAALDDATIDSVFNQTRGAFGV